MKGSGITHKQTRYTNISGTVKLIVTRRDNGRCVYCRRPGLPEAHFIPRSKGGLGVPQNVLTLCRECHRNFDQGDKELREGMREYFRDYLLSQYPDWDESKLIYHKEGL